ATTTPNPTTAICGPNRYHTPTPSPAGAAPEFSGAAPVGSNVPSNAWSGMVRQPFGCPLRRLFAPFRPP
ncbi:hypothetical protein ACFWDW_19120, partial [Streptomyces roseolus]|uniref:hypothetical protein n=1 Tax=Streptomyces roseolus TaxID=67358 RepID=UPI003652C873